jgi:hypothetical protein
MDYAMEYRPPVTIDMVERKNTIKKKLWKNPKAPFRLESAEFKDVTHKQFKYKKDPK